MKKELLNKHASRNGQGIVGGTLSLTLSTIIVKLIGVVYKIPLARLLSEEGMGYFNSAYTIYTFFYLLCTAGVPKAIMIIVSEIKVKKDTELEEKVMHTALSSFLLLGILCTTLLVTLSSPLAQMIGNDKSRATMISIAPSIVFISISGVLRGYLSSDMKLLPIAVSQVIEGIGKLALGLGFAIWSTKASLPLPIISALTILGVTFGSVFGLGYLYICYKNTKKDKKTRQKIRLLSDYNSKIIIKILKISFPITISAAIMSAGNIIDLMMIMRRLFDAGYSQTEASGLYGNYTTMAISMFNLAISLITPISVAFMPVFARKSATKDIDGLNDSVKSALSLTAFIGAPLTIGLWTYSSEILTLLFGNMGIETGAPLLRILSPAVFFMSVLLTVNSVLEAIGMVTAPIISMAFGSVAKILISYFLITNSSYGINAAPIATVASYMLALIVSLIISRKIKGLRIPAFTTAFLSYAIAFVSIYLSKSIYLNLALSLHQNIALLISIFICAIIYLALSVIFNVIGKNKLKEMAKYTNYA